jgi:hypothetical protein
VSELRSKKEVLVSTERRALEWARTEIVPLDGALSEATLAKLVLVAATYGCNCAPTSAREDAFDRATRFILLFLLVDDAAKDDALALVATSDQPWTIGRFTPALRSWLGSCEDELRRATPALCERLSQSFHDYLRARANELTEPDRPHGLEAHWAFRRRTIFLEPYIDLWMILLGIPPDVERSQPSARSTVIDIVLLANDLGSIERDAAGGEAPDDLNLVTTLAAEVGGSREEAVERLIRQHDELIADLRRSLAGARGVAESAYADLLAGMVDGNLDSLLALGFRYPGAGALLGRLDRVRPRAE